MTTPTNTAQKPLRIFCSYSHRDEEHLNDLRDWLRGLERQGLIEWWHDREISPGWEWEEEIDKHLRAADVILLLVSPPFMASDYVNEKEIRKATWRHKQGEARVIPIIVRPAHWKWASFGGLQALPKDAKPITTWLNRDEAWLDVVEGIQKAVEDLWVERQERAAKEGYEAGTPEQHAEKHTTAEGLSGDAHEDIRQRCREMADELRQFLEDHENLDEDEIMSVYGRRLGDKASALLEELEEHSLYPPQNLKSYQLAANANPLSPFAIRNLAKTLGTIGYKKSYETSGVLRVIADELNPGPVSIPEDEPYVLERPKYIGHGGNVVCLAPYNELDAAASVKIENAHDVYEVVVSYEVQSVTDEYSTGHWKMSLEARVWVIDEDGEMIRNLDFYRGTIDVAEEDGSWQHSVSGRCTFIGLEGTYSLKVVDYTEMHGYRGNPHRTYHNMRLRVTRR